MGKGLGSKFYLWLHGKILFTAIGLLNSMSQFAKRPTFFLTHPVDAFRLDAFRLDTFRLDAFRLDASRLGAFRIDAFRLDAFQLDAFCLDAFRLDTLSA